MHSKEAAVSAGTVGFVVLDLVTMKRRRWRAAVWLGLS